MSTCKDTIIIQCNTLSMFVIHIFIHMTVAPSPHHTTVRSRETSACDTTFNLYIRLISFDYLVRPVPTCAHKVVSPGALSGDQVACFVGSKTMDEVRVGRKGYSEALNQTTNSTAAHTMLRSGTRLSYVQTPNHASLNASFLIHELQLYDLYTSITQHHTYIQNRTKFELFQPRKCIERTTYTCPFMFMFMFTFMTAIPSSVV
jgi:hypothetical protein